MRFAGAVVALIALAVIVGSAVAVVQKDYPPQLSVKVAGVPGYIYYNRAYDLSIEYANRGGSVDGPIEVVADLPETFALAVNIDDPRRHGERLVWTLDGLDAGETGSLPITVQGTLPDDLTAAVYDLPGYVGHTAFVEGFEMPVTLTAGTASAETLAVADTGVNATASITVTKTCTNGMSFIPYSVSLYLNGSLSDGPDNIYCDGGTDTVDFTGLIAGSYQVVESTTVETNSNIVYGPTGCDEDGFITLAPGGQVTCPITNNLLYSTGGLQRIEVVKQVDGGSAQDFVFTSDITGDDGTLGCTEFGILDDDSDPLRADSAICGAIAAGSGPYRVVEDLPFGWVLESVECTAAGGSFDEGDWEPYSDNDVLTGVDISPPADVQTALDITCVFTNSPSLLGSLTIIKDVLGGENDQDFPFAVTEIDGCPDPDTLDDDGIEDNDYPSMVTCEGINWRTLNGNVQITETIPEGWVISQISCPDLQTQELSDDDGLYGIEIAVGNLVVNADLTCYFYNDPPDLVVVKECEPTDPNPVFLVEVIDQDPQVSPYGGNVQCGESLFLQLPKATYDVEESEIPDGWADPPQYAGTCTDINVPDRPADTGPIIPAGNVDIESTFTIPVCTITNSRVTGTLTIVKSLDGGGEDDQNL